MFANAVGQVAVAAGRDDTLPMLTGVRLEIEGSKLILAATDRFRLAVRELDWSPEDAAQSSAVLIPARTLSEVAKTLAGAGTVALALVRRATGCSASPAAAAGPPPGCSTPSSRRSAS